MSTNEQPEVEVKTDDELVIREAHYGGVDVTDKLKKAVVKGKLSFIAGNDIFGDTAINVRKKLIVTYVFDSEIQSKSFDEGDVVELP